MGIPTNINEVSNLEGVRGTYTVKLSFDNVDNYLARTDSIKNNKIRMKASHALMN